jgi:queuine tRNA-ribosyltransferase
MPVGTQGSVKALGPDDLRANGTQIILANTYHLMLRPGGDLLAQLGGVSRFMSWHGPVLTDSGGFQVFSLASNRTVTDAGVTFRSHLDGREHLLRPEDAVSLQRQFGSDIVMALDVLAGFDAPAEEQRLATERTHAWLARNVATFRQLGNDGSPRALLFGIAQGGFTGPSRSASMSAVVSSGVDGLAIGGLSVGEPKPVMLEMLEYSLRTALPEMPRYLMGVGSPEDLWEAVARGVDMFDCVLPTRAARHGGLYTPGGRVNIRAARFRALDQPVDEECDCFSCRNFSAAYLHHLFRAEELLSYRLASIHNLRFLHRQMEAMRTAIFDGSFSNALKGFRERYRAADQEKANEERRAYQRQRNGGRRVNSKRMPVS